MLLSSTYEDNLDRRLWASSATFRGTPEFFDVVDGTRKYGTGEQAGDEKGFVVGFLDVSGCPKSKIVGDS